MNIDEIKQRLAGLEEDVRKSYRNTTILDDVCTVESVTPNYEIGSFEQFASLYPIERAIIKNQSHFLLLGELGRSLARSEIELLLKEFTKIPPRKTLTKFSIEDIQNVTYDLQDNDFHPHTVFIPARYSVDVMHWNERFHNIGYNVFSSDLILDPTTKLKVRYSSKYAKFDNIIIVSRDANIWQFRPDPITNERITAKFNWEYDDVENASLLVRTVFRFHNPSPEANVVLELPHDQEQIENNPDQSS